MRPRAIATGLALALLAAAAGGCGSTSFSAQGFVKEANHNGAGLELGPTLGGDQPGKHTYEVDLIVAPGTPQPAGEANGLRGSLSTYDDQEAADRGLRECEATIELLCYQAANVVLVFEGQQPNAIQLRLAAALKKLAS